MQKANVDKQFTEKANSIANQLGISIKNISSNMGGFVSSEGRYEGQFVNELSYTFELGNATKEQADLFASILGDTGFETQEAVISSNYTEENDLNANATEVRLSVNNVEGLTDVLDKAGIKEYTIDRTNKVIKLFQSEFSSITEKDIANLMEALGGNLNGTESSKVESRYIGREARKGMYQTWLTTTKESNENRELRNSISEAIRKIDADVKADSGNEILQNKNRQISKNKEIDRKKGYQVGEIHASFNISGGEFEQINSEVSENRRNESDGLHYIDLSKNGFSSYIYMKNKEIL